MPDMGFGQASLNEFPQPAPPRFARDLGIPPRPSGPGQGHTCGPRPDTQGSGLRLWAPCSVLRATQGQLYSSTCTGHPVEISLDGMSENETLPSAVRPRGGPSGHQPTAPAHPQGPPRSRTSPWARPGAGPAVRPGGRPRPANSPRPKGSGTSRGYRRRSPRSPMGLVERHPDPDDGRRPLITPTAEGVRFEERQARTEWLAGRLQDRCTEEERGPVIARPWPCWVV